MEFVCYTDWDQLPASAEALFDRGEEISLFFSRRWFATLAEHALDTGQQVLLACVVDQGRVVAALPLRGDGSGAWHALSTFYTSLFTLLLSDENQPAAVDCLAEGLGTLPLQSLRLEPVADDDPGIRLLQQAMEKNGFENHRLFHFVNWSHRLHGDSFEQYFAGRPTWLRNTIARKGRKLQREHECEIRLYTAKELEPALTDYGAVYKASWKGGERFSDFVPALVHTTAAAGWLRLGILYIDGQPAAAQIWFVVHGKASIFRLVYDERWQRYSPGSILTSHLMEHVIDQDRVRSIDFLTGDERYKQDWMSERKERWRQVFAKKPERHAGRQRRPWLLKWPI